MSMLINLNFVQ